MSLVTFWFILITVLWIGYFFLEGFDFGVGMLLPFIAKNNEERRVLINTIGPVWDGNEVWLLTAGGAMFAAFPNWYATLFSGFYLPLLFILLALIVRGVAFEYRGKVDNPRWRRGWDAAIIFGSWLPPIIWGIAFANIVAGVPIDQSGNYTGNLFTLLNPFGLLGGVVVPALFLLHGANFISLKTNGEIRHRAQSYAKRFALVATVGGEVFLLWNQFSHGKGWTWITVALAAGTLISSIYTTATKKEGMSFILVAIATAAAVTTLFGSLYQNVMPSSTNEAFNLTIENASSTHYTLAVMTVVALAATPVVLMYQGWTYWIFRKRISTQDIPKAHTPLS